MLYICGDNTVLIPEASDSSFKLNQSSLGCHCTVCFSIMGNGPHGSRVMQIRLVGLWVSPSSRFLLAALRRPQWKLPCWLQPHLYSHTEWIFQMTHQSQGLQAERRFMLFQHIIYIFHNRSYRIISDKGQYFNFGKTFNWNIYKTWPYLMSSSMIWRREKQWVKHNHYLCETESYCQLQQGQRHSGKGPKGHEDMMGRDMIFRLKRGREEIIQNCLQ